MRDKVKVSEKFLSNSIISKIFKSNIGTQLYLCIGTTHIRSQYFNDAILEVARHIEENNKPQTVQEMRSVLFCHGQRDPAVRSCFRRPDPPYFYEKVAEGSSQNWESWNRKVDEDKAKYQALVDKEDIKVMKLVDAINGRNQWEYEII